MVGKLVAESSAGVAGLELPAGAAVSVASGAVVKSFAAHRWNLDAVEIDPAVVQLTYHYFGLREAEANVFPMDGRRFPG